MPIPTPTEELITELFRVGERVRHTAHGVSSPTKRRDAPHRKLRQHDARGR
jgi:hypothetical protein